MCSWTPKPVKIKKNQYIYTVEFDIERPVLYKVVTPDWKSLGLRNNPHILTYALGEWTEIDHEPTHVRDDYGIWAYRRQGQANHAWRYMKQQHNLECRLLFCVGGEVLHIPNDNRLTVNKIMPLEQLPNPQTTL